MARETPTPETAPEGGPRRDAPARPVPGQSAAPAPLALADALAGPETRMRDLLAFALAAEAGRPVPPGAIEALRNKAEAELQAHAFRILHNQVETIRRDAVAEQMSRMSRGLSFPRVVIANLVALAVAAVLALLMTSGEPPLIDALRDVLAQLLARLFAGP